MSWGSRLERGGREKVRLESAHRREGWISVCLLWIMVCSTLGITRTRKFVCVSMS
jgi:hypothetical protein